MLSVHRGVAGKTLITVSEAIHLPFDIKASSLPEFYKERLLQLKDSRITKEGIVVIKAQQFRTQEKNRDDALQRLQLLIRSVAVVQKARQATKPSRSSQRKRVDSKTKRGQVKSLRGRVTD